MEFETYSLMNAKSGLQYTGNNHNWGLDSDVKSSHLDEEHNYFQSEMEGGYEFNYIHVWPQAEVGQVCMLTLVSFLSSVCLSARLSPLMLTMNLVYIGRH